MFPCAAKVEKRLIQIKGIHLNIIHNNDIPGKRVSRIESGCVSLKLARSFQFRRSESSGE